MKKQIGRVNLILLICAMLCLIYYDIAGGLWLKGFTSTWFTVLGMVNLFYAFQQNVHNKRFILLIETGLVLGMCADVLLGVHFILGILSFALGHVMYLIAFMTLEKFHWRDLVVMIPVAIVSVYVVIGTPLIHIEDPILKKLLIGYAVIIAGMLTKALTNTLAKKSTSRKLILAGCCLFWFSDVMLAIDMFGESSRLVWILCSYTYWPAQNLLAHSLFHFVNEQKMD